MNSLFIYAKKNSQEIKNSFFIVFFLSLVWLSVMRKLVKQREGVSFN